MQSLRRLIDFQRLLLLYYVSMITFMHQIACSLTKILKYIKKIKNYKFSINTLYFNFELIRNHNFLSTVTIMFLFML